jgi:hypothetical protein
MRPPANALIFAVLGAMIGPCLADGDPTLVGCWEAERIVRYKGEQKAADDQSFGCTMNFSTDRVVALCIAPQGESRIEYSYLVPRAGIYRATIISNPNRPSSIGSTRDIEYSVKDDRLFIATYPQTVKPTALTDLTKVESISVRKTASADCRPERTNISH